MEFWLDGRRNSPRYQYQIASTSPFVLHETIEYAAAGGRQRVLQGKARRIGNEFVWLGHGVHMPIVRRWNVIGLSDDGNIAVLRYSKSATTTVGLTILVRDGTAADELRSEVARNAAAWGLALEDFATLTWR